MFHSFATAGSWRGASRLEKSNLFGSKDNIQIFAWLDVPVHGVHKGVPLKFGILQNTRFFLVSGDYDTIHAVCETLGTRADVKIRNREEAILVNLIQQRKEYFDGDLLAPAVLAYLLRAAWLTVNTDNPVLAENISVKKFR